MKYHGLTGLKGLEPEDALDRKLGHMLKRLVKSLRGNADLKKLQLKPLHRPVSLDEGLQLEAACTAMAWVKSRGPDVRGGPWCMETSLPEDKAEIRQVAASLVGKSTVKAKTAAVFSVSEILPKTSSLVRHLKHQCYKCGVHMLECRCRGLGRALGRADAMLDVPKSRSGKRVSGAKRKRPSGRKSGTSTSRPKGTKRPRSHWGKSASGSAERFAALPVPGR